MNLKYKIIGSGFYFPGSKINLIDLDLSDGEVKRLPLLEQQFTYISKEESSTDMAVFAAREAITKSNISVNRIGLVITAPSLITSYGLEIPGIQIGKELNLENCNFLNISQGCTGALHALKLASDYLCTLPGKYALVVTYSKSSTLMKNQNFGSFFWGDGAGAAVIGADREKGFEIMHYAEKSSFNDWGAMHIPFGDSVKYENHYMQIVTKFESVRSKMNYIKGERERFQAVLSRLLSDAHIGFDELYGIILPSTGRNRIQTLFFGKEELIPKIKTNFANCHIGAVDNFYFSSIVRGELTGGEYIASLSPSFTAQWAGVLLRFKN